MNLFQLILFHVSRQIIVAVGQRAKGTVESCMHADMSRSSFKQATCIIIDPTPFLDI